MKQSEFLLKVILWSFFFILMEHNFRNGSQLFNEDEYYSNYCYDMYHKKRGLALIFNHEQFNRQRQRRGTHIERLRDTFKSLDFKVKIYEDKTKSEIFSILQKGVCKC